MTANSQIAGEPDFRVDGHVDILYEMFEKHREVPFEDLTDLPVTLDKMKSANVFISVAALYCPDIHNGAGSAGFLSGLVAYAENYLTGLFHIRSAARSQRLHQAKDARSDMAHRKRRRVVGVRPLEARRGRHQSSRPHTHGKKQDRGRQ